MFDARWVLPCLRANFSRARHNVKAPDLGAIGGTERHHLAANAEVGAGFADENEVFPNQRGGGCKLAVGRVHDLTVPKQSAGLGVERNQVTVWGSADDPTARYRRTLVVRDGDIAR